MDEQTSQVDNVHELPSNRSLPSNGGNGGNGNLINFRLQELERRVGSLENKIDLLNTLLTKIDTKMDETASKSWTLKVGGTVLVIGLISIAINVGLNFI